MVRPLYPPRRKPKAPPPPTPPLWKSPQLIGAGAIVLFLVVALGYHISARSNVINPEALPDGSVQSEGVLSFLKPSRHFKSKEANIAKEQEKMVQQMGIASSTKVFRKKVKAKDLREQRRILAIQKYEASRETALKLRQERERARRRLSSPATRQLKDAVTALEDHDNLGIMKLERLLEEKLVSRGAERKDLDSLIYAYDALAKVYEKKNMKEKAKEAYINAFKLQKERAPDSQGPEWDEAIGLVEQMRTRARNN